MYSQILGLGFLVWFLVFCIDGMRVVALALANMIIGGAIFPPFVVMLVMCGWHFAVFLSMGYTMNLSL